MRHRVQGDISRRDELPGALTTAEFDATIPTPRRIRRWRPAGYGSDSGRDFAAWCASRGATALPAHQGIVAAYLSSLADSGRKASTIGRRAAAIGYHHKMAGHEPPTSQEGVRAVLRGIRAHRRWEGKAPATADLMGQMLALCPDTLADKRDRALLAWALPGRSGAPSCARWRSPISPKSPTGCGS